MNLEALSQVVFTAEFAVAPLQLATRVHRALVDVLASAHLLAAAESAAIDALREVLDSGREMPLGTGIVMHHLAPAAAGDTVRLVGFVQRLGDGATPHVDVMVTASGAAGTLAELELRFAIVERARFLRRVARCEVPRQPALRQRAISASHLPRAAAR